MTTRSNQPDKKRGPDKIQDALDILNEAAKEKQNEIHQAVEHQYTDFKQALNDALGGVSTTGRSYLNGVRKRAQDALSQGEEKLKVTADALDRNVQKDPWLYLGMAAASAFVLGYTFCQSRFRKNASGSSTEEQG